MLLSEVSGSLANYFPSSQGDDGLPGTPGLPVSSRHFIYISLRDLDVEEIPKELDILKRAQAGGQGPEMTGRSLVKYHSRLSERTYGLCEGEMQGLESAARRKDIVEVQVSW